MWHSARSTTYHFQLKRQGRVKGLEGHGTQRKISEYDHIWAIFTAKWAFLQDCVGDADIRWARHAATDGAFSNSVPAVIKAPQLAGKWNGNEGHKFANGSSKLQAPSRFQHHQRGKQSFSVPPSTCGSDCHSLTHVHVRLAAENCIWRGHS